MTEIMNCLPEIARKHFLNLRNLRMETETQNYQARLRDFRREMAAKGSGRSGWQEAEEWEMTKEKTDTLAFGFIEDAIATCILYEIPLTRELCQNLEGAATDLLAAAYQNLLRMSAEMGANVKIPLSQRQTVVNYIQNRRFPVLTRIQIAIETARMEDQKNRASTPKPDSRSGQRTEKDHTVPQIDFDGLLPLPSRKEYEKRLPILIEGASAESPLSFIMIDLDHFKNVNDTFGHAVGDKVLIRAAETVRDVAVNKGEAFRIGGEEIAVLLPNHDLAEAESVAARIRHSIESMVIQEVTDGITASLGVSTFPQTATDGVQLFQQADDALYASKHAGRNQVTCACMSECRHEPRRTVPRNVDPFEEQKLAEAQSLLTPLTYVDRDFVRFVLIHGNCSNHVAFKAAHVSDNLIMRALTLTSQQGIVERNEDLVNSTLSFSISEHWRETFKKLLFPREEGDHPVAFGQ